VTPEVLELINAKVIDDTPVVRDAGLVAAVVGRPFAVVSGGEVYRSIEEKAAAFLHSLVRMRPFAQGNKRTGWVAMRMMLRCHGKRPSLTGAQANELVARIDADELSVMEIVEALRVVAE
jgi:death-on-curing protein